MHGSANLRERSQRQEPRLPSIDLDAVVAAVAERVAAKVLEHLAASSAVADGPLLLTIEQAAQKLGRTAPAIEHFVRENKLPVVRIDRRVFIDHRDILSLIEQHKTNI